ncbi:MAG TPA: MBL fold metallo-hydrolase [Terracidiphilus sp.]|jgi:glyoxylase-like metal-dependent hydrolase (beta-lactamase superfamily II)|nr:MBL fold metallo-hydrolase [Terracidiphilus sp.]
MAHAEVPIARALATPMEDVAQGVRGLRLGFVNVFAVEHANGAWTLVDAGIPFSAGHIRRWAEDHYAAPPVAIVLTHGHFDHVSGAPELADAWDVPVYAHAQEAPYLTGQRKYPPPNNAAGGGPMSLLAPVYPHRPVDLSGRLRLFAAAEYVMQSGAMPEWQIIHTPGHTAGHVSFFRPADQTLLAGDAFCTTRPKSFFDAARAQPPELHGPPSYFTSDFAAAAQSIRRLAMLQPRIVAPGHGRPLAGLQVAEKLTRLAAQITAELSSEQRRNVA